MKEMNLFHNFIGQSVSIQCNDTYYIGKLVSIDGYLNCVLENCIIDEEEAGLVYIKGTFVEHVSKKLSSA